MSSRSSGKSNSFQRALGLLKDRTRQRRPSTLATSSPPRNVLLPNGSPSFVGRSSIEGMNAWLKLLGSPQEQFDTIHIAGTKGKGSTAAMTECLLRYRGLKTGLYTSPHFHTPTERIRINSQPVQEGIFASSLFELHDHLKLDPLKPEPRYLQILCLLSFLIFQINRIDVGIYETHHGGEYDSTNVIQHPKVTGITSIGLDHIEQLGPSIENVAWHKAGIFKPGAAAFTVAQSPNVQRVLKTRAMEKGVELMTVEPRLLENHWPRALQVNQTLAVAISNAYLKSRGLTVLSTEDVTRALHGFVWPGRFNVLRRGSNTWFVDGAHNVLSLECSGQWFSSCSVKSKHVPRRTLLFSNLSDSRDGKELLRTLLMAIQCTLHCIVLTTYGQGGDEQDLARLEACKSVCSEYFPLCNVHIIQDPAHAIDHIMTEGYGSELHIYATGSLRLVGRVLEYLKTN